MGHREDLLAGAKKCLSERGYAHTTARDIVAASGANLASIGYHFGSKEELLVAAMFEHLQEIGREPGSRPESGPDPRAAFADRLDGALESFDEHRDSWAMTMEVYAQIQRSPRLKGMFADRYQQMRVDLASELLGAAPVGDDDARRMGSVYLALLAGLAIQRLLDPVRSPSSRDVVLGLRAIADRIEDSGPAGHPAAAE